MIDPSAVIQGAASGYLTQKTMQAGDTLVKDVQGKHPTEEDSELYWLKKIYEALSPPEKESVNLTIPIKPYPSEYIIPDDLYGHPHVCVFLFNSTPLRFDGVFGGTYQKTVGPGWFQLDVPGRLSTTDIVDHPAVISYRQDALGGPL